jgi:hypothetical protein
MNLCGWRVANWHDLGHMTLACLACEPNPFFYYGVPNVLTLMICFEGF